MACARNGFTRRTPIAYCCIVCDGCIRTVSVANVCQTLRIPSIIIARDRILGWCVRT